MDLPETMRALTLLHDGYSAEETGSDLDDLSRWVELSEVPVPTPGPGQALVRVTRAAANPSDAVYMKGRYGQPRHKGVPAGFEGVGTVVAGDTPLVGQRVSFAATGTGSWAEYALTDAAMLVPLHPAVSDDDAAGLIVNPVTAIALFEIVRASGAGSFVATAAGSQLGKFLIELGRDHGIPCIAVVRRAELVEPLRQLGAAEVLVQTHPGLAEHLREAIAAHRPGVLLDPVAGPVSSEIFFAMPPGARWVVYGRLEVDAPRLDAIEQLIFQGKRIEGFWLAPWLATAAPDVAARVLGEVQTRFADGRWRTEVTATVRLAEAMTRLPEEYGAKDGKVLITP